MKYIFSILSMLLVSFSQSKTIVPKSCVGGFTLYNYSGTKITSESVVAHFLGSGEPVYITSQPVNAGVTYRTILETSGGVPARGYNLFQVTLKTASAIKGTTTITDLETQQIIKVKTDATATLNHVIDTDTSGRCAGVSVKFED